MKVPCLLTLTELLAPMRRAIDKVDDITRAQVDMSRFAQSSTNKKLLELANEGVFVLLVSTFEVMLSDLLTYYLQEFPEKMEFKSSPFATEEVVGASFTKELWGIKAESLVRSKMYQDISEVLKYFLATLSIDECPLDRTHIDKLTELKQSRNLLLHSDLVTNSTYLEKAGPAARANRTGQRLAIDDGYLEDCIVTLKCVLVEIERRLAIKYASYSRLAALERLWNYMISNPKVTPFADYWYVDAVEDVIRARRNPEAEQRMGSAERLFLALWRDSLNGTSLSFTEERLSFTCLSRESVEKVAQFLFAAKRMGVIAN